jgi:hypothetical protein
MIALASSPLHAFAFGGIGCAALGLVFVVIGVAFVRNGSRFERRAERAEGEIVGYSTSDPAAWKLRRGLEVGPACLGGTMADDMFRPIVVFRTRDGQEVRATSRTGTNPRPGRVGRRVTVFYDPQNPQRILVDIVRRRLGCMGIGFIFMGGLGVMMGVAMVGLAYS